MSTITWDAFLRRINRRLWHNSRRLSKVRGIRIELGEYIVVDYTNRHDGVLAETHVNPLVLGTELGVLRPSEKVADK